MTTFAYPLALLLLIPFAAAVFYAARKPKPTVKVSSLKPFAPRGKIRAAGVLGLPFLLYALAAILLIVALARPRKGIEHLLHRAEGIDIMLAIDLSGSMKALDVPANITSEGQLRRALDNGEIKNRLEVAKEEIVRFIERRPNDRIGLISFAPLPYVVCPPTLDHPWLIRNLARLQPGMIGDATGIAGPIASAVHRLKNADSKRRVVVLFTDGSNNVDAKISPRQAAKLAKKFDVVIYTVGIGSNRGYVFQQGMFGRSHLVPLQGEFDEDLLKDLADLSEGRYYKAADAEGLENAMNEIDKLEKTTVEQPRYMEYKEWAPRLIIVALGMLLAGFLLEHTLYLKIP